jgi:WD40 repeat protein
MDGVVRGVDVETGAVGRRWRVGQPVTAIAATGDGRHLIYGTDRGVICLRRIRDGALLQCMTAHRRRVSALEVAGTELISGGWDGAVRRYQLPSLRRLSEVEVGGAVNDLAAADGSIAAAVSSAPPVGDRRRRDLEGDLVIIAAGTELGRCAGHDGPVTAVRWAGSELISGGWDRTIRGWRVERDGCRERWRRDLGGHHVTALAAEPRRNRLAVSLWVTALDQPGLVVLDYPGSAAW